MINDFYYPKTTITNLTLIEDNNEAYNLIFDTNHYLLISIGRFIISFN